MNEKAYNIIKECIQQKSSQLNLDNCKLTDMDFRPNGELIELLKECNYLETLNLSNNHLETLIDFKPFQQLKFLYVRKNKIKDLSPLKDLVNIKTIVFSNNDISHLVSLSNLKYLQIIDLSSNNIEDLIGLSHLKGLLIANLSNNRISHVNNIIGLPQLRKLYLNNNKILSITEFQNLKKLKELYLDYNKITAISGLNELPQLCKLSLVGNHITDIENLNSSFSLNQIDLSNNLIVDLKPILGLLKNDQRKMNVVNDFNDSLKPYQINISKNPLTTPPIEIAGNGNSSILNYFSELENQGFEYLFEAKMLIVGQPAAGKTSLRHKLHNSGAPLPTVDKTTRGIDIDRLEFITKDFDGKSRRFYYNVWDFGGQQIYQTTHQFFLTHRSLYILVIDTGKDSTGNDDTNINYWLQAIELLGGNSPLLVVKNEKNERIVNIDIPQKRQRFKFLKNDYSVDLNAIKVDSPYFNPSRLKEFNLLKQDIETELERLPLVGFPMPKNWFLIREKLQLLSTQKPYIHKLEYIEICQTFNVDNYERQMELSKIFHDLGIFLHFQDYRTLEDFIILKNTWATDAVFTVLDNKKVQKSGGKFNSKDLLDIWENKTYEQSVHYKLLALMMQFELCYQVDNSDKSFIIPEMLSQKPPSNYLWEPSNDLVIRYRYDFMPKGILTRFIVRMHKHIDEINGQQTVWKTGVKINGASLSCPSTLAEVSEGWDNKQLDLRVQGPFAKELISKITYQLDELNNEYFKQVNVDSYNQKSRWYKLIPCNCNACKEPEIKHFYDYNDLIERKQYGKKTIECFNKPYNAVKIAELIDGVFLGNDDNLMSLEMENKTVEIFISYSNKDRELLDLLYEGINSHLKTDNGITYTLWSDKGINMGDQWEGEIMAALKRSKIAILLVSANFTSSKFIQEVELFEFFRKRKQEGYLILPILIRSYNFAHFESLSSINFFKTYYNEYGYNKPGIRDKLMPFDVLGDNELVTNKQLQDYYYNLSRHIDISVKEYLNQKK